MAAKIRVSILIALLTVTVAHADDITESDRILCSVSRIMLCVEDGECFPVSAIELDAPQFLVIDLKKKTITTTEASAEHRLSNVANLVRENGRVFLQGIENNRAYSILIEQDIGRFTGSVSRDGITMSTFGACTDADVR